MALETSRPTIFITQTYRLHIGHKILCSLLMVRFNGRHIERDVHYEASGIRLDRRQWQHKNTNRKWSVLRRE